ncbi:MAG: hypothetical protein KBA53_14085 [Thermoclostridium sp.]|nr:hypothetical protein [Thermoclostridium sp.]
MYKMFCKSLENYLSGFTDRGGQNGYRYRIAKNLNLLADTDAFNMARKCRTAEYFRICDLLHYMSDNIEHYPKFKAFLWTLESREMYGEQSNLVSETDLREQAKIIQSILNMQYWN